MCGDLEIQLVAGRLSQARRAPIVADEASELAQHALDPRPGGDLAELVEQVRPLATRSRKRRTTGHRGEPFSHARTGSRRLEDLLAGPQVPRLDGMPHLMERSSARAAEGSGPETAPTRGRGSLVGRRASRQYRRKE
jgi:hypothetical protein